MIRTSTVALPTKFLFLFLCGLLPQFACVCDLFGQTAPYDTFPDAKPPYYRVRYEASEKPGELIFGVNYTVWIPEHVKSLRGVIVHQHGCGEGSCRSGLSGAYDLHWQALAEKYDCALLAPAYEQPAKADCQMWCDPRNGSDVTFQQALIDLGEQSQHPELAEVPWALWGHSGGGHWAGGMALLHPEKVAAVWLRSGVPLLEDNPERPTINSHVIPDAALSVPIMCNPGTEEGVTVKEGRFARVWPANELFFNGVRQRGGLIGVAVDPLTSHQCGNQRYLAIRWLDCCLALRLPKTSNGILQEIDVTSAWYAETPGFEALPRDQFTGDPKSATWLPDKAFAKLWQQYVKNTEVEDLTPPSPPEDLYFEAGYLNWIAKADVESGIAKFLVYRDDQLIAEVGSKTPNRFGRPVFQNLLYSDTPTLPLNQMRFKILDANQTPDAKYHVITVNTVGRTSEASEAVRIDHTRD